MPDFGAPQLPRSQLGLAGRFFPRREGVYHPTGIGALHVANFPCQLHAMASEHADISGVASTIPSSFGGAVEPLRPVDVAVVETVPCTEPNLVDSPLDGVGRGPRGGADRLGAPHDFCCGSCGVGDSEAASRKRRTNISP